MNLSFERLFQQPSHSRAAASAAQFSCEPLASASAERAARAENIFLGAVKRIHAWTHILLRCQIRRAEVGGGPRPQWPLAMLLI